MSHNELKFAALKSEFLNRDFVVDVLSLLLMVQLVLALHARFFQHMLFAATA